uniref:DUF3087 domain-containing protein n=1 Tax=Ningiella ruwaisensis TaxID=2364274 RepID=UPI0010A015C6|nr:DUF3087 domain-containing protein [Ningiella ruwaisensis]
MELVDVNKARYRKHLNIIIVVSIVALAAGSLGISQSLIALFPDPDGSHFHWNLLGVILTVIAMAMIFRSIKHHPFMTEVTYVWELKKVLNRINRKGDKIKHAAQQGDVDAMTILQYSYSGSRLLWNLDDNNIVIDELTVAQAELDTLAKEHQLTLEPKNFKIEMLEKY